MSFDRTLLKDLPLELRAELEENLVRKPFTQSELAEIQEKLRQSLSERFPKGNPQTVNGQSRDTLPSGKRVDDIIGEVFGESRMQVHKRREIFRAADEHPELIRELDAIGEVEPIYRKLRATTGGKSEPPETVRLSFRLTPEQNAIIERALATCHYNRELALVEICSYYLEHEG